MNRFSASVFAAAFLSVAVANIATAKSYRVTVAATTMDRAGQVVAFRPPADAPGSAMLRDASGKLTALQIDSDGMARFVIATQKASESLTFDLVAGKGDANSAIAIMSDDSALGITSGGQPVLAYRTNKEVLPRADIEAKFKRAGYLHPVFSPSGKIITGDYPSNHIHQHAIWTAWSKTQFQGRTPNFWEMAERTGTVEFTGIDRKWNGPVHGGFVARQRFVDLSASTPVTALNETWEVTFYYGAPIPAPARIFDLGITQACATTDPVVLPKQLYGGLGFRGRDEWNGKDNLTVLTSEGATTRTTANTTRVRWLFLGGVVDGGAKIGIAILGHAENLRAPQPLRVHPDFPYACFTPVQLGDVTITPATPYVARYRFVTFDGFPDRAQLDAYWNGYVQPAVVTIEAL